MPTAVALLPLTVIQELTQLERDLDDRRITLWIAGLPPRALQGAQQLPRWAELQHAGRLHPTALAATHAYRTAHPGDPPPRPIE